MVTLAQTQTAVLPPGSRLPALVQTALFMTVRPHLLRHLRRRHGEVFTIRLLGGQTVVTLSSPDHIREVFAGTPAVFHAGEGNEILRPVMGPRSVMITDEDEHLRTRKLLMPAFNGAALRGYGDMMTDLAERNVETWQANREFPVHAAMNDVTLEIILRVVFGMADGPRLTELRPRIRTLTDINPITALGWSYPALARFPPWRRSADNLREVDRLLYAEIADRRAATDVAVRGDVLSRLLSVAGTDLTDAELRDQMITLLLAGHETTATALAWSFHDLARNPAVLRRAQDAADIADEDYLQAVAKEALRRHPIIQNVPRVLTEPTDIAGHHLPARTIVAANTTLAHENPDHHEDPREFRPERFLGKPLPLGTWIPFGGGVRRCLGAGFSLKEMSAVLRAALTRYDIRPAREAPEFAKPRNITLIPSRGARIIVTPRA
ncbi:cytochrome P450 [Actinophytocola glycyrrhizae]|uniref:Cytochrome P450 n=1 Tax=Actinophytocola glycyrrhizae TaxID=2044873 RepID=A0ABV9RVB6_9PSEU